MAASHWLVLFSVALTGCGAGGSTRSRPRSAPANGPAYHPASSAAPSAAPSAARSPFSGDFSSTRGPMRCSDNGANISCSYGPDGSGRLNCVKEAEGALLTCTFSATTPVAESGHVIFTRSSPSDPRWQGELFYDGPRSMDGPGVWNAQQQP